MDKRKVISVVCLSLFLVMFFHTITEHSHNHDCASVEITEMHHHHCNVQEDEVVLRFEEGQEDVGNIIGTPSLPVLFLPSIVVVIDNYPEEKILFPDDGVIPLSERKAPVIIALRAPPVLAIC